MLIYICKNITAYEGFAIDKIYKDIDNAKRWLKQKYEEFIKEYPQDRPNDEWMKIEQEWEDNEKHPDKGYEDYSAGFYNGLYGFQINTYEVE